MTKRKEQQKIEAAQREILGRSVRLKISLAKLAREAGVSRQSMWRVAAGLSSNPRLRMWVCQRLGFRPEELGWPELKVIEKGKE